LFSDCNGNVKSFLPSTRHNFFFHLCSIHFRSLQKQQDFIENLKIFLKPLEGGFPFCSTKTVNNSIAL